MVCAAVTAMPSRQSVPLTPSRPPSGTPMTKLPTCATASARLLENSTKELCIGYLSRHLPVTLHCAQRQPGASAGWLGRTWPNDEELHARCPYAERVKASQRVRRDTPIRTEVMTKPFIFNEVPSGHRRALCFGAAA